MASRKPATTTVPATTDAAVQEPATPATVTVMGTVVPLSHLTDPGQLSAIKADILAGIREFGPWAGVNTLAAIDGASPSGSTVKVGLQDGSSLSAKEVSRRRDGLDYGQIVNDLAYGESCKQSVSVKGTLVGPDGKAVKATKGRDVDRLHAALTAAAVLGEEIEDATVVAYVQRAAALEAGRRKALAAMKAAREKAAQEAAE